MEGNMPLLETSVIAMFGGLLPFFILAVYLAYRARVEELKEPNTGIAINPSTARSDTGKTIVLEIHCLPAGEPKRRGRFGRKAERAIFRTKT